MFIVADVCTKKIRNVVKNTCMVKRKISMLKDDIRKRS